MHNNFYLGRPGFGITRQRRKRGSDLKLDPPIHWLIKSLPRHMKAGQEFPRPGGARKTVYCQILTKIFSKLWYKGMSV